MVLPHGVEPVTVQVSEGKISAIGYDLASMGEVIEADGLTLLPGIIDPQVHFREPGSEYKEDLFTGSCAAAAGGVTSFLDMPNNQPAITTVAQMDAKKRLAALKSVVNYGFFMGATPHNLEELLKVDQVCGIKIFMGSSTGDLLVKNHEDLERIFSHGTRLIAVHAEDEFLLNQNKEKYAGTTDVCLHPVIRSPEVALAASSVAVALSLKYQRRLHLLHVTTEEETQLLRRLPQDHRISAEVCPQHFILHAPHCYEILGTLAQMNPPLREARHGDALWQALKDGILDCIATDHAPHTLEEKAAPYGKAPSGMPGVETSLPLMLDRMNQGLCSLNDIAEWMSTAPARLYQMQDKGKIEVGMDADLVLVDLSLRKPFKISCYLPKSAGHLTTEGRYKVGLSEPLSLAKPSFIMEKFKKEFVEKPFVFLDDFIRQTHQFCIALVTSSCCTPINWKDSLRTFNFLKIWIVGMLGLAGIVYPLVELQAGGILIRGDYLYQTLSTSQDYNKFISDRFGVENLSIKGPSLSLVYMAFGGFGVGIEQDALETDIPFTTLNGNSASGSLSVRQSLLTIHYALPLGFDISVGIGTGELKRTLPGYQTESITAENIELNQGNASEKPKLILR